MSLRQKTISGIGWATVSKLISQGLRIVLVIILARLLTPEDFGLLGMVVVFTGFAGIFSDAGFGPALIQKAEIEERHLSSVFWIGLIIGSCLLGLTISAAPSIAAFYDEPQLEPLATAIAFNFIIVSFTVVPAALLRRSMRFKLLTLVNLTAMVLSGGAAIIFALFGFGVWTLVWKALLSSACTALGLWILVDWKPRFVFQGKAVRELLNFSGNLMGFSTFNYWVRNADNLLIGKVVGSAGLGLYTRAYSVLLLPVRHFTSIVGQVMFPALSRIQGNKKRVKRAFLRANRGIALVTVPMMLGLFVIAKPFVLATFGPKWEAVIPMMKIFCLIGVIQPSVSTVGWLYLSQGRADWQFRWGIGSGIFYMCCFIVGIQWGVMGVATAYALGNLVLWYPGILIPGKLVGLSFWEFIENLGGVFGSSLVMAGVLWATVAAVPASWPSFAVLVAGIAIGVIVYWGTVEIFKVKAYSEMRDLIGEQRRRLQDRKSSLVGAHH